MAVNHSENKQFFFSRSKIIQQID